MEAELLEDPPQDLPITDDRLEFLAHLHRARLDRSLVCQQALARFRSNSKHTALPANGPVLGIEQRVLL